MLMNTSVLNRSITLSIAKHEERRQSEECSTFSRNFVWKRVIRFRLGNEVLRVRLIKFITTYNVPC